MSVLVWIHKDKRGVNKGNGEFLNRCRAGEVLKMELDYILLLIEENGYVGLFLWLWFGVFGIPVPNEVIAMTVGMVSSMSVLHPLGAFLVTYAGMTAALTTCYTLGRFIGRPLIKYFHKRKRFAKIIDDSLRLMDKHHAFSLSLSYFIPGLRNFVPFLYGFSRLPFKTFALFAFSGALLWLAVAFTLGYLFGDHIDAIILYGKEALLAGAVFALIILVIKTRSRRKKEKQRELA